MIDTRWGGEARNDRRLLVNLVQAGVGETKPSTPAWEAFSRRQRVNRERPNPNPNPIIIKCFDLSFSWFLEVPRADLSVPHPSLTIYSSCLRLVHGLYSLPWPRAPFRLRFNVSGRGSRVSFGRLTQVTEGGMTFGDSLTLVTQPTSAPYPLSSLKF